jgi:hypothetical protein
MLPLLCQEPHPRSARKSRQQWTRWGSNRCGVQLLRCVGGKHSWRTFVPNPWSAGERKTRKEIEKKYQQGNKEESVLPAQRDNLIWPQFGLILNNAEESRVHFGQG